ncbi:MAG: hypothetical protein LBT38_09890 [Deltaproteobacteria bacterium]|jgi:uncharacterized protein YfaS (alpha-2-macroglobulin family)|nr:hypothetical protein [Deltaproteobacteria bacterium]
MSKFSFFLILALSLTLGFTLGNTGCESPSPKTPVEAPKQPVQPIQVIDQKQAAPAMTGQLEILQFLPQGSVKALNQIIVAFNQPMVALGNYENAPKDFMVIEPALPGQTRWLNEYTLAFTPEKPLYGSSIIKVSLKPGLKSLSGAVLKEGAETLITLPEIEVNFANVRPPIKPEAGYRPTWRVDFNQPVDLVSINQNVNVVFKDLDGQETRVGVMATYAPGYDPKKLSLTMRPTSWQVIIQPDQLIPLNTPYEVVANPGLVSLVGPLPSAKKLVLVDESSPGPLTVVLDDCSPDKVCQKDPSSYLGLKFNNQVDYRQILANLKFDPPYAGLAFQQEEAKLNAEESQPDPSDTLYFWHPFRALTKYEVTVKAGLTDIYGQSLAEDLKLQFETKEFSPEASLQLGDGFFETSTPPIVPVQIVNKASVLIKGYAMDPDQARQVMSAAFSSIYDSSQPTREKLQNLLKNWPAKDVTLRPPDQAKYGPLFMGVDLKALFGEELLGHTILLTLVEDGQIKAYNLYQVTDLGLTAKIGWDNGLVWMTDLAKGEPLAGVDLTIYGPTGQIYWHGVTDETGLATLPGRHELLGAIGAKNSKNAPIYLWATRDGQSGFWNLANAEFDYWRFNISYDDVKSPFEAAKSLNWLLSAQPIYQPGETIKLKGVIRVLDGEAINFPKDEISLAILSPQNALVRKETVKMTEWGSFYTELELPNPALGSYKVIWLKNPNYNLSDFYGYPLDTDDYAQLGQFVIQNFRTPAFDLAFSPITEPISGQKTQIVSKATYHFGSPVVDNPAIYSVMAETAELSFPQLAGFQFLDLFQTFVADCDSCSPPTGLISSGSSKLDQQGQLTFDLTIPEENFVRPRKMNVSVAAEDVDKRVVAKETSFVAHPAEIYVALNSPTSLTQAGEPKTLELAVVDLKGQFLADQTVDIELIKRSWQSVRVRDVGGSYAYSSKAVNEPKTTLRVQSTDRISSFEIPVAEPGYYYVRAKVKDKNGRLNQAAVDFYAYGAGAVGWNLSEWETVTLIPDKRAYNPGDTAKILVQNPFQSGQGLLTVERAGVRQSQTFALDTQSPVLTVPLSQDDGPNVYVSVTLTRGRVAEKPDKNNVDLGKPAVREGYLSLAISGNPDLIKVNVKPQKPEYKPQEQVTVDIEAKTAAGEPFQGEVALVAIDAGVVQVGGDAVYFPAKEFFKNRPLLIATFNNLASLIGRRDWAFKGVEPGGGGAPVGQSRDLDLLRSDFKNLAHFEPFVRLDEKGQAQVSFKLPDNLTTFKIYAVATGAGRQTGSGESKILVTKNFLLRPSLPQQAAVGDEFTAAVIVTNRGAVGEAEVAVKPQNLTLLEPVSQKKVTIAAGASQEVGFRVKAEQAGPAYLTFEASFGQEKDATKSLTPIHYLSPLTTQVSFRELKPGPTEVALSLGPNPDLTRGDVSVNISPTLAPFLIAPWVFLDTYSYQCLEQTTSRAFGALAMTRAKNWTTIPPEEIQRFKEIISAQLNTIVARELDGGYALWPSQSGWRQRDPSLSVYILSFLIEAKKDGFSIPQATWDNTLRFVNSILSNKDQDWPYWYNDQAKISLIIEAVEVLARAGVPVEPYLESFYQSRENLNYFELLTLTRAINSLPKNKDRVDQLKILLGLIANQAHIGPSQVNIPALWIDQRRLTALTLLTLAEVAPYNELIPGLVRALGDLSDKGGLGSTQANIASLLALSTYLNKAETETPKLKITINLGEKDELAEVNLNSFVDKPPAQSWPAEVLATIDKLIFQATGSGRAWALTRLSSASKEPDLSPVIANGLTVSRNYAVLKPTPQSPGQTKFERGQVVKVTVTFMTPINRHNLILEDPIPAGFEAINFSLKDSDQTLIPLLSKDEDSGQRRSWFEHEEFWPNRVMATARYLPAGVYTYTYLIRPATPGVYMVPGPKVEEMYSPENFGRGAGVKLTID